MAAPLQLLTALARQHAPRELLTETGLARLALFRADRPFGPYAGLYEPLVCLVLQGRKRVTIGEHDAVYAPGDYFVATVELPVTAWITEASREHPYLAVSVSLDAAIIGELIEAPPSPRLRSEERAAFSVSRAPDEALDAWSRLLRLLDAPGGEQAVLAPMIEREIVFRLLQGPQGGLLREIAQAGSRLARIQRGIDWIRARYDQPLRIAELARHLGMSASSLHRQFKLATAMSPLQYQKQIRLREARRLLLAGGTDAARTAYAVGYESPSQFSREYARLFGAPPLRDVARLHEASEPPDVRAERALAPLHLISTRHDEVDQKRLLDGRIP